MSVAGTVPAGSWGRQWKGWRSGLREALHNPIAAACRHVHGSPVFVVVYHTVCETNPDHIKNLYRPRTPREFSADMEFLCRHFEPIDLPTLLKAVKGEEEIHRPSVLVTFDDGLREMAEVAMPILKGWGIKPALYVNLDFLDNRTLFFRQKASLLAERLRRIGTDDVRWTTAAEILAMHGMAAQDPAAGVMKIAWDRRAVLDEVAHVLEFDEAEFLARTRPYLTRDEVRALKAQGVAIGAHGFNHPNHRLLSPEERLAEVVGSTEATATMFGTGHRTFAFPFSDQGLPGEFFDALYAKGVDLTFGTSWPQKPTKARQVQRFCFETGPEPASAQLTKRLIRSAGGTVLRGLMPAAA